MTLAATIHKLERQASKADKLAKAEKAKADALREKLEQIQNLLRTLNGKGVAKKAPKDHNVRRKRKMSAAGRARIIAAQKERWAAFHAGKKGKKVAKAARKAKRKLSPEGRARIIAAVKARWAKQKAARAKK